MAVADRCPVQPRFMHHDNNQRCASVSFVKTGGAGELVDGGIGGLHRVLQRDLRWGGRVFGGVMLEQRGDGGLRGFPAQSHAAHAISQCSQYSPVGRQRLVVEIAETESVLLLPARAEMLSVAGAEFQQGNDPDLVRRLQKTEEFFNVNARLSQNSAWDAAIQLVMIGNDDLCKGIIATQHGVIVVLAAKNKADLLQCVDALSPGNTQ